MLSSLAPPRRAAASRPTQFAALDELRLAHRAPAVRHAPHSSASDREQALGVWLDAHGVGQAWEIAPALAAAGVDTAWCDRVADAVPPGRARGRPGVGGQHSSSVTTLLTEMQEATRRISELVAAVRSYSQVDRASHAATWT